MRMVEALVSEINLDSFREQFIKYTRQAFQMLPKLETPRILDIGCGSGLPTLELARLSDGEIIRIDIDPTQLKRLNQKIVEKGLSQRVKTIECSVVQMDFPDEYFDILWAEGVIRIVGFKKSLKAWHRLLKPTGFLVVHDTRYIVATELTKIRHCEYNLIDYFALPEAIWWTDYDQPLALRIKKLQRKCKNHTEALKSLQKYQTEIDLVERAPEEHNSAFYMLQKS